MANNNKQVKNTQAPVAQNEKKEETVVKQPKPIKGTVNCSKLRIRKAASLDADVLKIVESGAELSVQTTENPEWLKVKVGNTFGFVVSKFVNL